MKKTLTYIISILFTIATVMLFTTSCSQEEDLMETMDIQVQSPYGKWSLEGFTTSDAKARDKTSDLIKTFTLTLNNNGTYSVNTANNTVSGEFKLETARRTISFPKEDLLKMQAGETDEGKRFTGILMRVSSYRVYTDKLYLISDNESLEFSKIKKEAR